MKMLLLDPRSVEDLRTQEPGFWSALIRLSGQEDLQRLAFIGILGPCKEHPASQ